MTINDLKENISIIEKDAADKIKQLKKEYCLEHNTKQVGQTFTDHSGDTILIQKILTDSHNLCCVYEGVLLNKDGTPKKKSKPRQMWQCNEKKS